MDRPLIYSSQIVRTYDHGMAWRLALESLARLSQDVLGVTSTVIAGLQANQQSPASMNINISPGSIYELSTVDPTAAGALPASTDTGLLQGILKAQQTVTIAPPALLAGQSVWALVEVTFSFVDTVPSDDPSGGVLPFFNSSNPSQPLQGQGGSGAVLNTRRTAIPSFLVKYGSPSATGSEVPPNPDTGYIGLYLIDIAFAQIAITQPQILVAGPSVGTGVPSSYPAAPFLIGLLNSHHHGLPGQAPQINLASEVQGILPLGNLPASRSASGILPVLRLGTGNPSGSVAGNVQDFFFDTVGNNLYVCLATGNNTTTVWSVAVTSTGAAPTGAAGGDDGGSFPNPTVVAVHFGATRMPFNPTTPPTTGQSLFWDGTNISGQSFSPAGVTSFAATHLLGSRLASSAYSITADLVMLRNPTTGAIVPVSGFSGTCAVVGSQTGSVPNGRDTTAAFAANVFYHLYVIGGGGQSPALLASLSGPPTGPVLPTNYTSWAYVATLRTDASANVLAMYLAGKRVQYSVSNSVFGPAVPPTSPTAVPVSQWVPAVADTMQLYTFFSTIGAKYSIGPDNAAGTFSGSSTAEAGEAAFGAFDLVNIGQAFFHVISSVASGPTVQDSVMGYTIPNGSL